MAFPSWRQRHDEIQNLQQFSLVLLSSKIIPHSSSKQNSRNGCCLYRSLRTLFYVHFLIFILEVCNPAHGVLLNCWEQDPCSRRTDISKKASWLQVSLLDMDQGIHPVHCAWQWSAVGLPAVIKHLLYFLLVAKRKVENSYYWFSIIYILINKRNIVLKRIYSSETYLCAFPMPIITLVRLQNPRHRPLFKPIFSYWNKISRLGG